MLVLHCILIQSARAHVTCGKGGGYTPAPAITLKGNQGDREGDTLLKALQLKPLVPSSKLHLLPNKGDSRHSFITPNTLGVNSIAWCWWQKLPGRVEFCLFEGSLATQNPSRFQLLLWRAVPWRFSTSGSSSWEPAPGTATGGAPARCPGDLCPPNTCWGTNLSHHWKQQAGNTRLRN